MTDKPFEDSLDAFCGQVTRLIELLETNNPAYRVTGIHLSRAENKEPEILVTIYRIPIEI